MTDNTDTCELNDFRIVHIHNRSDKYHLTRQTLLDSALTIPTDESMTQNTYSFFYHILSKNMDDFNYTYGSFAYGTDKVDSANIYINVNPIALGYIIDYIQTGNLNAFSHDVNQVIDLATIFAMPDLVEKLRSRYQSDLN